MRVTQLELTNFRNLASAVIEPCEGVNLIYGDNAQGKTNLLESIWLFTGCRSFRGAKDAEFICFGKDKAALSLDYYGEGRNQNLMLSIEKTRHFTKNGIKLSSPSKVMGSFLAVVFSPVHLSLIKDGPYERRKFLDTAISQLKPKYALALAGYNKALAQRNMLLKDLMYHSELYDTLDVWEEQISFYAAELICQRIGYINRLSEYTTDIYGGISGKKELLRLTYQEASTTGGSTKEEIRQGMRDLLRAARKTDLVTGSTSVGPHRDDLFIEIDNLSARSFGSQGQQRSAALALKLGEAAVIRRFSGEQPVALLDDVMSELDTSRQNYILNHIRDWQVFITCCDPASVQNLKYGQAIRMQHGTIM